MTIIYVSTTTTSCSVQNLVQSKTTYSCQTLDGDLYNWSTISPDGISLLYLYFNHNLLLSETIFYLIYWPLVF